MTEVRITHLSPRKLRERREACPVGWLPLGTIEWHGKHLPLGVDGLQAEGLCAQAAREIGGVVFPPMYYGDHRGIIVEAIGAPGAWGAVTFDHRVECCRELGVSVAGIAANAVRDDQRLNRGEHDVSGVRRRGASLENDQYAELIERSLWMVRAYGFSRIVVLPGHGGTVTPAKSAVIRFNAKQSASTAIWAFREFVGDDRIGHADAWETSTILYLHPELVHLDFLADDDPEEPIGLTGHLPASEGLGPIAAEDPAAATAARGRDTAARFVERIRQTLAEVPPPTRLSDPDEDDVPADWTERVVASAEAARGEA